MIKKILIGILVIVGLLVILDTLNKVVKDEKPIFPISSAGEKGDINLFAGIYYSEGFDGENIDFLSSHFDLSLMAFPIKESVDKLRSKNSEMIVLLFNNPYFAFGAKFWEEGIVTEEVEPDWMLRDEKEELIYIDGSTYEGTGWGKVPIMDVRNIDWQKYYASESKKYVDEAGMDGLFIDTFSDEYQYFALKDGKFAKGYSEELWKNSSIKFMNTIKNKMGTSKIIYNGIGGNPDSGSDKLPNERFLNNTSGTAYEAFSVYMNMDKSNKTKKFYFDHTIMNAMKKVTDMNKIFLVQVSGINNKDNRLYALASFLLLQNDKTYFYYAPDESQIYWYPEWETKTGKALGDYYIEDGIYKRDFENVIVSVDPERFIGKIINK